MANIQPFEYQKRTNIEEHNDLVSKINEIVDVINNVNLDTINSEIDNLTTRADKTDSDLASVQAKDIVQDSEITNLKPRVAMTETEITNLKTRADKTDSDLATVQAKDITQDSEIDSISKSLVSNVVMSDGTTMGSVQVSIEREDGALITSKNYKWGRDIGIRLEAGTQAGYVKAVIDLSDGTVLESNEYRIVEVLESDIYVTAITLVANQTDGTLGGNISYSNGTTQTINSVSVPTAPGVTTALESLQSRMTAVEQKNTTQDGQITALDTRVKAIEDTPGVGQFDTGKLGTIAGSTIDGRVKAESDGTGSVNGWGTLKDRVTAVEQKNTSQDGQISSINSEINGLKSKNTEQDNSIAGKVAISQGAENVGKALIIGSDGNVIPGDASGGEVWEEVSLSNWPTDWVEGDRIKIQMIKLWSGAQNPTSSWTSAIPSSTTVNTYAGHSPILEFTVSSTESNEAIIGVDTFSSYAIYFTTVRIKSVSRLNEGRLANSFYHAFSGGNKTSLASYYNKPVSELTDVFRVWRLKKSS